MISRVDGDGRFEREDVDGRLICIHYILNLQVEPYDIVVFHRSQGAHEYHNLYFFPRLENKIHHSGIVESGIRFETKL